MINYTNLNIKPLVKNTTLSVFCTFIDFIHLHQLKLMYLTTEKDKILNFIVAISLCFKIEIHIIMDLMEQIKTVTRTIIFILNLKSRSSKYIA